MSASIRIKIIGGTDIKDAYYDCAKVSSALGGMSVETVFNGVSMFYYHQPVKEWIEEYHSGLKNAVRNFQEKQERKTNETGVAI